jgi:hypothetical protein
VEEADLTRCMRAKCQLSCNWPEGAPVLWRYSITFAVIRSITREIQFDVCWSVAVALKWLVTHSSSSPANTCVRCDFRDMEISMKILEWNKHYHDQSHCLCLWPMKWRGAPPEVFPPAEICIKQSAQPFCPWCYLTVWPFQEEIQTQTRNLKIKKQLLVQT